MVRPAPPRPTARARLGAIYRQRCPRCLRGRVFRPGNWLQMRMYYACPECRVIYGRESGYFTGAMIVSYILAVPVLAVLTAVIALFTGWRFDVVLLIAGLYFLIFLPMLFRYSRLIWMHFDRLVDADQESERYVPPRSVR